MKEDATTARSVDSWRAFLRPPRPSQVLAALSFIGMLSALVVFSGEDRQDRQPGKTIFDFVAHLPTSGWLYVAVGLTALLGFAIHWCRLGESKSTVYPTDTEQLSLLVVDELRERALALRTRAVVFLGSSIMLLLGGVYTTIWVVPIVPAYDVEERVRALLQLEYVDVLDAIREGNYWLYAGDVEASDDTSLRVFHNENKEFVLIVEGNHILVSGDGLGWVPHESLNKFDESVAVAASNTKGAGLVGLDDESVRTTQDGGITWPTKVSLGRPSSAVLAGMCKADKSGPCDDGLYAVVSTMDGAVHYSEDYGKSWRKMDSRLDAPEKLVGVEFGEDGPETVVGHKGTVLIRDDPPPSDPLLAAPVFSDNGRHGVVVETLLSLSVESEQGSWSPAELLPLRGDYSSISRVEVFDFDAEGVHGMIGTGDDILVTADGGKTWATRTPRDVGLKSGEGIVGAVIGSSGPQLVLGHEGSVRVMDGGQWKVSGPDRWPPVTAIEFGTGGLHGVIGTRDGDVHMTEDGGRTWSRWTREHIGLNDQEWVVGAVVGSAGPQLVLGDEGSMRVRDGEKWKPPNLDEWPAVAVVAAVTAVKIGADGQHRMIGTRDGTVHITKDGGKRWTDLAREQIGLNRTEWAVDAVVGSDGVRLVRGDEGSVRIRGGGEWVPLEGGFEWLPVTAVESLRDGRLALLQSGAFVRTTENGGSDWAPSEELSSAANEAPHSIKDIHSHEDHALLLFETGSAWTKHDGRWLQVSPGFDDESVAAIALDENSEPVLVGTKGATLIDGRSERGRGDLVPEENEETNIVAVAAIAGKTFALVKGKEGKMSDSIYVRGKFPYLADDVLTLVGALQEGSRLRKSLVADIPELAETLESSGDPKTLIDKLGVDQVHWLRAVATLATIYLVQLFVGLYRYSVRLSAFWDSRADAVLLSTRFSSSDLSFDDLIAALAPDALDFKPPRYPYFPSWRRPSKPRRVATTPDEVGSEV